MTTINLQLTPEEHYALTALLRSGLSIAALKKLGLHGLTEVLAAPYRAELQRRSEHKTLSVEQTLVVARGLPSMMVGRYHQADRLHPSETCMPMEWFTWHQQGEG